MAIIEVYLRGGPLDGTIKDGDDGSDSLLAYWVGADARPDTALHRLTSDTVTLDAGVYRVAEYVAPAAD